jgi:hypothetical protein
VSQMTKVVTLHWYNGKNGHVHPDAPTLAICYSNGRMQIMRNESDDSKLYLNGLKLPQMSNFQRFCKNVRLNWGIF